jgi:transposase
MRVSTAVSRLLCLPGVWVRSVRFKPDRVVVTVALRVRLLRCPKCRYSTRHRESKQHHDSVWRHLDLGRWRLEVHARLLRLRCPEHGALVEGVPFARDGVRLTSDFENLVAWLVTKTDKTATCRLTRIDWKTIDRVITRVGEEMLAAEDRLTNLFEISIDEVAWREGHRYLTWVGDHRRRCVVWGREARGRPLPTSSSPTSITKSDALDDPRSAPLRSPARTARTRRNPGRTARAACPAANRSRQRSAGR